MLFGVCFYLLALFGVWCLIIVGLCPCGCVICVVRRSIVVVYWLCVLCVVWCCLKCDVCGCYLCLAVCGCCVACGLLIVTWWLLLVV